MLAHYLTKMLFCIHFGLLLMQSLRVKGFGEGVSMPVRHSNPHFRVIVYDEPFTIGTTMTPIWHICKDDEYEINVQMSSDLWSGTNDKVEIRIFGPNKETTEWVELTKPSYNGFERLSNDTYCVRIFKHFSKLSQISIRKTGTDDLMIDEISIWRNVPGSLSGFVFPVGRWITENTEEYFFKSTFSW